MVLANVELKETYDSVWDFTEKNLKEIKKIFKTELKDLEIKEDETEAQAIANNFIENGTCDEEVISIVLQERKKKYFLKYVEEGNGYFKIYEVKD